jgi:chromosomal replication initiator protein
VVITVEVEVPLRPTEDAAEREENQRAHRAALNRMPGLVRRVAEAVCDQFDGVRADELVGESRRMRVMRARQMAIYLTVWLSERKVPPWSMGKIGKSFGGRDHTTAIHDDRRMKALILEDPYLAEVVERLKQRLMSDSMGGGRG